MHATQITTNTRKHIIMGQTFYIQEKEMEAPRLHDIRGLEFLKINYFIILIL